MVDGKRMRFDLDSRSGSRVRSLLLDSHPHRLVTDGAADCEGIEVDGRRFGVVVTTVTRDRLRRLSGGTKRRSGPGGVKAPMPGMVISVSVAEGDFVRAGQGVVVVEAMKMENRLPSPADGAVRSVHVAPGDRVGKGELLVELEHEERSKDDEG